MGTTQYDFSGALDKRFIFATPETRAKLVQTYYTIVDNIEVSNSSKSDDAKLIKKLKTKIDMLEQTKKCHIEEGIRVATKSCETHEKHMDEMNKEMNKMNEMLKEDYGFACYLKNIVD